MLSPDEEQSRVEQVMAVMNQDDPLIARRVLRKWNGDVERAITAMLSGDTAVDEYPPTRPQSRVCHSNSVLLLLTPVQRDMAVQASHLPSSISQAKPNQKPTSNAP